MKKNLATLNDTLVETKTALEAEVTTKTARIDELKQQKAFAKKMARLWTKRAEALDAEMKATRKVIKRDMKIINTIEEEINPLTEETEVVESVIPDLHLPEVEDITAEERESLIKFIDEAADLEESRPIRIKFEKPRRNCINNNNCLNKFLSRKR